MTFTPTGDEINMPAICHVCGRQADGVGVGSAKGSRDPRWVCDLCGALGTILRSALRDPRRMTIYEEQAVKTVIDKVAPLVEQNGSDLGDWDEAKVTEFVTKIVTAYGPALRTIIIKGEAPF